MNASYFHSRNWTNVGLAILAATLSGAAGSQPTNDADSASAPVVVAQASANSPARSTTASSDAFPAHQRGVRAAAAQGPDALRRYVYRTRMIHGFYYNDFAPKE